MHVRLRLSGAQEADGGEDEEERAGVVVVQAVDKVVVDRLRPQSHLLLHEAHDSRVHRAALLRATSSGLRLMKRAPRSRRPPLPNAGAKGANRESLTTG